MSKNFTSARLCWLLFGRNDRPCLVAALFVTCLLATAFARADNTDQCKPSAAQTRIRQTVEFLAADAMQGRGLGTKGLDRAADFLGRQFVQLGLKADLCDGRPFQTFEVRTSPGRHRQRIDWWSLFTQGAAGDGAAAAKADQQLETAKTPSPPEAAKPVATPDRPKPRTAKIKNVVAALEGEGPRAGETIVIGAHYDHRGEDRDAQGKTSVYNGANDNASGTAALLEIARTLAQRDKKLPRRIVFVAFSGEEHGLLGSFHYTNHPVVPLDKTIAMINLDMVGRMDDDRVVAFGMGSSPALARLVGDVAKKHAIKLTCILGGTANSDHGPFYARNIPVVHLMTFGGMGDYHCPSDDADKLNYEGIERIAAAAADLAVALAETDRPPAFTGGGLKSMFTRGAVRLMGQAAQAVEAPQPSPAKQAMPTKAD